MANEELKSSNEEYQSVNEEFQSANEELESAKEELQSINEELNTINAELASKNEALAEANSDLKNLLDSTADPDALPRRRSPDQELHPGHSGRLPSACRRSRPPDRRHRSPAEGMTT